MSFDGPPASGSYPSAPPVASLIGQVLEGRYRIIKLIGEGGMGEVYAAEHVHIDKKFAVKLLKAEIVSNPEAVARFQQEARSSSSIKHRNIIAIDDFGQLPDGRIYMCMELLNGAALNDMIQQPMGADRLLNILIQSGHGLAAAHAKGIVHRDMKPENIFVTIGPNGEDVPKLLDFGIAKVSGNDGGNHLTRTGTIFGTPFYMAPEQALGNPVDARTDIYAVGVIMYECFAGSLPFQGESFMGILTQHITTEPEPVAQRAAKAGRSLPMGLADIITRCMQKDPARRFSSMDELVNALIAVYRGIAGPGMSTYMEAFPAGSAQHVLQPTPPPMGAMGQMSGATPHATPMPMSGGYHAPSQPQMTPMGANVAPSGPYAPLAVKKSKTGLIIAVVVVLAAAGGIAAFLVLGQKDTKDTKAGSGSDSGSQVAVNGSGSAHVVTPPDHNGSGSDVVKTVGSGSAEPNIGSAATVGPGPGSNNVGSAGSAATAIAPEPIDVLVMANAGAFEIWQDGKKLVDGPDNVKLVPGTMMTLVLKAKGYKDKTLVIDGKKTKVTAKLDRIPGVVHPVTNPVQPPPPGHPDCATAIKDPHDKHCVSQYCSSHSEEPRCNAE